MTDLTPVAALSPVVQLETNDRALAGTGNPMNRQAQALLNRDAFRAAQIADIAAAAAAAANDVVVVRQDLANDADPAKGAGLIARGDQIVNSITELRSLLKTSASKFAFVIGYYVAGDGGGGRYWLDAADTTSLDNGGTIIVATDGGRWKLVHSDTISLLQFGAVNDGATNSTAECQAAINAAIAVDGTLDISGNYAVTNVTIENASGLRITGRGSLVGIAAVPTPCIFDARNVINVAVDGAWFINSNYNENYDSGIWIYTDGPGQACAFLELTNVSPVNTKIGWRFGNPDRPDDLVSEINIRGGMTSGCPVAVEATGLQTVVNFNGTTLLSSYGDGGASWQLLTQKTVVAIGATVHINGGELVHPAISAGTLCEIQPLAGAGSTLYGNISVNGAVCEPACPLATTSNPNTLVAPLKGAIQFTGCNGVHTQDSFAFVQTDADFVGRLQFTNNYFHATVARTNVNIQCGGNCEVFVDQQSFGPNFLPQYSGVVGGLLRHDYTMVMNLNNLNGQTINNNVDTLLNYTSVVNTGNLARFTSAYSAGVVTVPSGGWKNVRIETQLLKSGLTGEWYVRINDNGFGVRTLGTYNQNSYSIDSLSAGDTIKIVTLNTGGILSAGSATTDWLQIFASS